MCLSVEPVYEACRSRVQQLLRGKLLAPSEATTIDFYALGYYYLRAVDLGFIGTTTPRVHCRHLAAV